jgi:hypothetical protein
VIITRTPFATKQRLPPLLAPSGIPGHQDYWENRKDDRCRYVNLFFSAFTPGSHTLFVHGIE